MADINIPPSVCPSNNFLYSGGFFISGIIDMGTPQQFVWSNGVATSSRILDYLPGLVGSNPSDLKNKFYIIIADDSPFSESWQEWKDAVSLGADFYDGDGDNQYNPIDKNKNGKGI